MTTSYNQFTDQWSILCSYLSQETIIELANVNQWLFNYISKTPVVWKYCIIDDATTKHTDATIPTIWVHSIIHVNDLSIWVDRTASESDIAQLFNSGKIPRPFYNFTHIHTLEYDGSDIDQYIKMYNIKHLHALTIIIPTRCPRFASDGFILPIKVDTLHMLNDKIYKNPKIPLSISLMSLSSVRHLLLTYFNFSGLTYLQIFTQLESITLNRGRKIESIDSVNLLRNAPATLKTITIKEDIYFQEMNQLNALWSKCKSKLPGWTMTYVKINTNYYNKPEIKEIKFELNPSQPGWSYDIMTYHGDLLFLRQLTHKQRLKLHSLNFTCNGGLNNTLTYENLYSHDNQYQQLRKLHLHDKRDVCFFNLSAFLTHPSDAPIFTNLQDLKLDCAYEPVWYTNIIMCIHRLKNLRILYLYDISNHISDKQSVQKQYEQYIHQSFTYAAACSSLEKFTYSHKYDLKINQDRDCHMICEKEDEPCQWRHVLENFQSPSIQIYWLHHQPMEQKLYTESISSKHNNIYVESDFNWKDCCKNKHQHV